MTDHTNHPSSTRPPRRPRRRRRFIVGGLLLILAILVAVVALLPMILSAGYGRTLVRNLVQDNVHGTVTVDSVTLRWSGPQEVRGVAIDDTAGERAMEANVSVPHSLLRLLFNRDAGLDVALSGAASSDLDADGSLSIMTIFRSDAEPEPSEPEPAATPARVPPITINVDALRLELRDPVHQRSIVVPEMKGAIAVKPGDAVTIDLGGDTNSDGLLGSVRLVGQATGALDAGGRFTPRGATLAFELEAHMMPVLGMEQYTELQAATVSLVSDDLTDAVVLSVNTDAEIDYQPGSRLVANIAVKEPFAEDGTLTFAAENLAGKVLASRVPSPLIQPFLADLPIRLMRDVGPTLDAEAHFEAGETIAAQVYLVGEKAELNVTARFNTSDLSWTGDALSMTVNDGHPDLIEAYTGLTVAGPVTFFIGLDSFTLPPIDPVMNARPRGGYAATGRLEIYTPALLVLGAAGDDDDDPSPREPIRIDSGAIRFDTPALAERLDASGELVIEDGTVTFEERLTHLIDESGALSAMHALASGSVTVRDLPRDRLLAIAPAYELPLRELLGAEVSATIDTFVEGDATQRAAVSATSGSFAFSAHAVETPLGLTIEGAQLRATATPALAAHYLGSGDPDALALAAAAPIEVDVAPFSLPANSPRSFSMPTGPISAEVRAPAARLANVPGLAEPVEARQFRSTVTVTPGETMKLSARGTTSAHRAAADQPVSNVTFNIDAARDGETWRVDGAAELAQLQIAALESLLGRDARSLSNWVGADGSLAADFSMAGGVTSATIRSALAQLTGTMVARLDDQRATITSDDLILTLARAPIEAFLNQDQPNGSSAGDAAGTRVTVPADVPVAIRLKQFDLPRRNDEPGGFALDGLGMDIELRAQPLLIRSAGADQSESSLRDLYVAATSSRLSEGVDVSLTGKAGSRAGSPSPSPSPSPTPTDGNVRLTGALDNLVAPGGALAPAGATVDLDAQVEHAPTIVADALLGMNGYLLATVGPRMNAVVRADDFSRDSGSINIDIVTTNGYLRGQGTGRDGLLTFVEDQPIEAQLEINPLLREKVLARLHPLLKDVLVSQQPLRATVRGATLPLDGDVSRLNAMIDLAIGAVEFDRHSPLFSVLALAQSGTPTLGGAIEPVRATITDGIVRYDRFNVTLGEISMPYEGRVDLNTRSVSLRTTLPLGALASRFKPSIGGEVGAIAVPIVTRGSFGALKTEISPDFDMARAILDASLKGSLDDKLPIPIGNILDRLGGQKDGKKDEKQP